MVRDFTFWGFEDHGYMRYVIDKPRFPKLQNHDKIKLGIKFCINKLINQD